METEKIIRSKDEIKDDLSLEDREREELMEKETGRVKREKWDLSSTRTVLYKLMRDGTIKADDKLIDVLSVIEEEYAKIESI